MDASAIQALLGLGPTGFAAVALWWAYRKDQQCEALMSKMTDLATQQAVGATEVKNSLDAIRDAIRTGVARS